MRFEGQMHIGEASRYAAKPLRRVNGGQWSTLVAIAVAGLTAFAVALLFTIVHVIVPFPQWLWTPIWLLVAVIASYVAAWVARTLCVKHVRRALAERGVTNPLPMIVELRDNGVRAKTGDVETTFPWHAVTEAIKSGPYWVLIAQATPTYIPLRLIGDMDAEAAFVRELSRHMGADAVARSDKMLAAPKVV